MKIPNGYYGTFHEKQWKNTVELWDEAASKMSMKHGVLVEVGIEVVDPNGPPRFISRYESIQSALVTRIVFKVMNIEFESLKALKTALRNKAFM